MYGKITERPINRIEFYVRLLKHFLGILGLITVSLLIGMYGL